MIGGPLAYVIVWLFVLPVVAELSTAAAVLSLMVVSSAYCYLMAREKGRNGVLWSILGGVGGFVELGVIPVVIISALSYRNTVANKTDGPFLTKA
jgi:hypothetical protein